MIKKEELRAFMNDLLEGNGNCTDKLKEKYVKCQDTFREFDQIAVEISTLARKAKQLLTVANEKENAVKRYMQKTEATSIAETTENMHIYASRLNEFSKAMEEYDLVNQKIKELFEKIAPLVDREYSYGELISSSPTFTIKKNYTNDWENIRVIYYGLFDDKFSNKEVAAEEALETVSIESSGNNNVDVLIDELKKFASEKPKRGFFRKKVS